MDQVLAHIAHQANLERVLFTPALKKLYFDLAVSSGGANQFKHADSIRNGMTFVTDKVKDEKQALLFCATHELIHAFDLMLKTASGMIPVVMLAVRGGISVPHHENDSLIPFSHTGWAQFHTATQQELYDHLAMAFHLSAVKKTTVPMLIVHSWNPDDKELLPRDEMDLGAPQTGFATRRNPRGLDFDAALASVGRKKEKPSIAASLKQILAPLRETYHEMGYTEKEYNLPVLGKRTSADSVIITSIPPSTPTDDIVRFSCIRPLDSDALCETVAGATSIAVVEPEPVPGSPVPPFFAEINALFPEPCVPVLASREASFLSEADVDEIHVRMDEASIDKPLRLSSCTSDEA